jgi:hypothetical protein
VSDQEIPRLCSQHTVLALTPRHLANVPANSLGAARGGMSDPSADQLRYHCTQPSRPVDLPCRPRPLVSGEL